MSCAMHLACRGTGEPILFIHGMPTNGRIWNKIIERLCGRYTCFTVDLPGLGKTPRMHYGPEYLRELAEQIERLRLQHGIAKWHIVGHDAGSAVAVHYAHFFQAKVDCMVLLSPAVFPELEPYFLIESLRTPVLGEIIAPVVQALFWRIAMRRAIGDEQDGAKIVSDFHAPFAGPAGPWRFMKVMRWGEPSQLLAEVPAFLPQLLMPTLIFHGSRDAAIPESFAHRAASLIPNAGVVMLDSGHFIPLHQSESVASTLARFFEIRSPRSTSIRTDDTVALT